MAPSLPKQRERGSAARKTGAMSGPNGGPAGPAGFGGAGHHTGAPPGPAGNGAGPQHGVAQAILQRLRETEAALLSSRPKRPLSAPELFSAALKK